MSKCSKCNDTGWYRFGDSDLRCWDCRCVVPREEWERMQRINATMKDALEEIRFHGIDKPSAMGGPDSNVDVDWWRSIVFSCMRKAANALDSLTPSNAVESKNTQ